MAGKLSVAYYNIYVANRFSKLYGIQKTAELLAV